MEGNILESLKGVRRIFNMYISAAGLALLALIVNWINQPSRSLLLVSHLNDAKSLVTKLRDEKDPLSKYLKEQLSSKTRQRLQEYDESYPPSELLKTALVDDLNLVLKGEKREKGETLWDEQRFKDVILTDKTQDLIEKGLGESQEEKDIIRLNRLLLEEAYQYEIAMSEDVRRPIIFLNLEIYREYFSLVYGILFGGFIITLFSRMRLLKITIDNQIKEEGVEPLTFFPWVASPFHKLRSGFFLFLVPIAAGFIELGLVTKGHLFPKHGSRFLVRWLYELIGCVDAVVLVVGMFFLVCVYIDTLWIRKKLSLPGITGKLPIYIRNVTSRIRGKSRSRK